MFAYRRLQGVNDRQPGRIPLVDIKRDIVRLLTPSERTTVGPSAADGQGASPHGTARGLLRRPRQLIHHGCTCQLRLRVTGGTRRTERNIFRETQSSGNAGDAGAAGRRHYSGPDRFYDQLGPAKFMVAPSIHKALLTW